MKFSKKIVILVLTAALAFTVAMVVAVFLEKPLTDSLIIGFYGFFGAEAGVLGWIKRKEQKNEQKPS